MITKGQILVTLLILVILFLSYIILSKPVVERFYSGGSNSSTRTQNIIEYAAAFDKPIRIYYPDPSNGQPKYLQAKQLGHFVTGQIGTIDFNTTEKSVKVRKDSNNNFYLKFVDPARQHGWFGADG